MSAETRTDYLATRVHTASSAQLHLMLIEGALRLLDKADKAMMRDDEAAANAAILSALKVVEELLAGVRHSTDEINTKLAQLYQFVYVQVTRAYVNSDRAMVAQAVRILEFQRETWRQACDLAARGDADKPKPHAPQAPAAGGTCDRASLSLEA